MDDTDIQSPSEPGRNAPSILLLANDLKIPLTYSKGLTGEPGSLVPCA